MPNVVHLFDSKKFKFMRFSGKPPGTDYLEQYNAAYDCWRRVWQEAFKGLNVSKAMVSDEFTRQDEILTIFYNQECVGMMFFRVVDLSVYAYQNDTYFKLWTPQDFRTLTAEGPLIAVMSNMTISPDWRKDRYDLSMKDLVVYYTCRRFQDSSANTMATFTRNSKNVNALAERFGGLCIRENIENYGPHDLVNLFRFTQPSVTHGEFQNVKSLGQLLYRGQIIVPSQDIGSQQPHKKSA